MTSKKIKKLVLAAFFVALDIIVARFLSFEIAFPMGPVRFDFQIVVAALCGYALGPFWGALSLASADLLGVILNSGSLGIFLGFTLSAAVRGFLFGLLLHKREIKVQNLLISIPIVFVIVDLGLGTLWLSIMLSTPYLPLFITRIVPKMILLVVEVIGGIGSLKLYDIIYKRMKS